jgi:CDGSH-type Zn-finger protein
MATTRITVNSNGSLKIEGDFEIVDRNGNLYDLGGRTAVSICRCGLSGNKPFCDSSHKGHFEHEAIAFALPPKKLSHRQKKEKANRKASSPCSKFLKAVTTRRPFQ